MGAVFDGPNGRKRGDWSDEKATIALIGDRSVRAKTIQGRFVRRSPLWLDVLRDSCPRSLLGATAPARRERAPPRSCPIVPTVKRVSADEAANLKLVHTGRAFEH